MSYRSQMHVDLLKNPGAVPGEQTNAAPDVGLSSERLAAVDWKGVEQALERHGFAVVPGLASPSACDALAALYAQPALYRARIVMARHGFGRGEYQYFAYPLPDLVSELRSTLYPPLVPLANRWNELMADPVRYPAAHAQFIGRCHQVGQTRPTPLILEYGPGDHNCLHQDVYGEHVFPLQAALLLSQPGVDFTGGEFVLTTHRGGHPTDAEVVPLRQGDAVIFAVNRRPVRTSRGHARVAMRHGVSRIRSGRRHTLGVIFHDAK